MYSPLQYQGLARNDKNSISLHSQALGGTSNRGFGKTKKAKQNLLI